MADEITSMSIFAGRLNRLSYLLGLLFQLLTLVLLLAAINVVTQHLEVQNASRVLQAIVGFIWSAFYISLQVRRYHDLGRSGWWMLLYFLPPLGPLLSLALIFIPGNSEPNKYGFPNTGFHFRDILGKTNSTADNTASNSQGTAY